MQRELHCRACEHEWEGNHSAGELPVPCPECESTDTYSAVGNLFFRLRQGGVGWAINGYHNDGFKHYDLGKPDPKKERWGKVKN